MKGSPRTPQPHPLSLAVRKSMGGVSLVELLLVAGVIVAGTAVVLTVASNTQAQSKRSEAQRNIQELHSRILSSHQATSNFSGLTTESALDDGLFPREMLDPSSSRPVNPWGGAVTVSGTSRNGGVDGSSLVVTLEGVPASDCTATATALSSGFSEIVVNQISVGAGNNLNVGQLGEACSGRGNSLIQLYWDNTHATEDLGSCSPTTETQTLTCPAGQLGSIVEERLVSCSTLYGEPSLPGPWSERSNTCAPICVVPSPSSVEESRSGGSCPVGQLGERVETRTRSYSCAGATGSPDVSYTPWALTTNTCAPICVAPAPNTETRPQNCPTGQLGEIIESRTRTWTCPAPTGSPTGTWTPWAQTTNTCAPQCIAPPPTITNPTRNQACVSPRITPAGQSSFTQTRTGTVVHSCPAPTGNYTSAPISYTPWTPTESQACADRCVLPNPNPQVDIQNRENTQTIGCPSGQLGQINQVRDERRTRTRTASCPAPTGNVSWTNWTSWGSWQAVNSWRNVSNSCAPVCVLPSPSTETRAGTAETRTVSESRTVNENQAGPVAKRDQTCPANQYGLINQTRPTTQTRTATQTRTQPQRRTTTQRRTASCPAPTGNYAWSGWSAPGAPYGNWTNNGSASAWSANKAPYGNWSSPVQTGSWVNASGSCTNCPAPTQINTGHRWDATYTQNCPSGQWGIETRQRQQERRQTRSYNCPAGTRTLPSPTDTWGGWYNNGVTRRNSITCANCPAPTTESQTRWDAYINNCPANQYGQVNRERELRRTRTRSYSCPAGTTTLPNPSYTPWTAYSTTGTTRLTPGGNTCKACPTLTPQTQTTGAPASDTTQTRWQANSSRVCQEVQQRRTRSASRSRARSYNCPAGTRTLPGITYGGWTNWSFGSWSSWSNTGSTRNRSGHTDTQNQNFYDCPFGQYAVAPGYRTRSFTCSNQNQVWGAWRTITFPQCCREGQQCYIH